MATGLSAAEGFGTSQLRRFFLPGIIAAIGLHLHFPTKLLPDLEGSLGVTSTVLFLVEVVLFGFLITSATVPIFHLYEGFLLPWLTEPARIWNGWRVSRQQKKLRELYGEKPLKEMSSAESAKIVRIEGYLSDFPIRQQGEAYIYEVERPTRIGNIIATYELYPQSRYAIDGIFFWFHLVHLAPEVSRDDFQENSVLAESILLASAAGALVALVSGSVLLGLTVGELFPALAILEAPASERATWASMIFGLFAFLIFYRLSWPAYRAVGKSFCALVDLSLPAFQDWASKAPVPPPEELRKRTNRIKSYLEILDFEPETAESRTDTVKEPPNSYEAPGRQGVDGP